MLIDYFLHLRNSKLPVSIKEYLMLLEAIGKHVIGPSVDEFYYLSRATLVKESADEVLAALGVKDDLLDIAKELEAVALSDDYFIERKLYPNVDFYTGLIYKAMGFPTRMFTVLFALGRLPGWIAQWREMIEDPDTKIGRPRQVYIGETLRDYTPVAGRPLP